MEEIYGLKTTMRIGGTTFTFTLSIITQISPIVK